MDYGELENRELLIYKSSYVRNANYCALYNQFKNVTSEEALCKSINKRTCLGFFLATTDFPVCGWGFIIRGHSLNINFNNRLFVSRFVCQMDKRAG